MIENNHNQNLSGVRLKEWREKKQLSQLELAKRLGVTQPSVSQFESGARPGSPKFRLQFILTFGRKTYNEIFAEELEPA